MVLVDRRPTNMQIREKGAAGYYADVAMCVDAASGYVFGVEVLSPMQDDGAVLAVSQKVLEFLQARAPEYRVTWVARQEQVARLLASRFGGPNVVLESGESFGPWDEAYLAMDRDLAGGGMMVGYLWRRDISPEEVATLFEEAAHFYQLRPWQFVTDSELLEKPSPVPGEPPLLICVTGNAGISKGLALFDSRQQFEDMTCERGFDGVVHVGFERREKMPHTVVQEAEEHGWAVASKSAFPMVVRVRNGKPGACTGNDLRRATAALRALNEVTRAYRESRKSRRGR